METKLRKFSIMIPRKRMVEVPMVLLKRIESFVNRENKTLFDVDRFINSFVLFNYILICGEASTEAVTVLAAFAQGHDVEKVLDMFEVKGGSDV